MSIITLSEATGPPPIQQKGLVHKLALTFVWLAVASGAVVFTEPAPVDIATIGLIGLLPVVGLVRLTRVLMIFICLWIVVAAASYFAAMSSSDIASSVIHSSISLYLYFAALIFAAFVAAKPLDHARLIMHAYFWSAFICALAGIAGYFDLLPGANALFTKFGRASGTFKDPNVYGPFLIPALLYGVHQVTHKSLIRALVPAVMAAFLALAVLLCFSRGAWVNLAIAGALWGVMSFVTAPSNLQRLKLIAMALAGLFAAACLLTAAMQSDKVSSLFAERASLDQSYDYGPDGRFGGHEKAGGLVLDNPLGLGAQQFPLNHHHEEVHNVYLNLFMNAGWLGGLLYIVIVAMTLFYGLRHGFRRTAAQPIFLVVYASLLGNVIEGLVIDTDHWRHFYLLLGLVWGLMVSDRGIPARRGPLGRRAKLLRPLTALPRSRRPKRQLHRARRPLLAPIPRRRQRRRRRARRPHRLAYRAKT